MNNRTIFVPDKDFRQIEQAIKKSGVKFYPFSKVNDGYEIVIQPQDHPVVTFLLLKYEGIRTFAQTA